MNNVSQHRFRLACILLLVVGCIESRLAAAPPDDPSAPPPVFGFAGPEVFPIDSFITQLRAADLDGDGLNDLVIANNSRSRLSLLYNQTGRTNTSRAARQATRRRLNELPPDARFRIDSIASEKRIAALVVTDLNADRRPDIAYYGEPRELVVQYNQGPHGWSTPRRFPIEDGQLSPNALTHGDLNGDRLTDLILLGESTLYWLAQKADHTLAEAEKIPYSGAVKSVQALDIDGNHRDDLLLVNWENANPFRFRLQDASGQLGPEVHFTLPAIRSYWADDLDGDRRTEIVTIAMQSGRAQISHFARKPAESLAGSWRAGQFQLLPLNKTTKARRGTAWGDVNADQRADLVVAEPDSGQITVYLQKGDGQLGEGRTFPTLTGVSDLLVAPAEAGAPAKIYLLSPDERLVGVTAFDPQGRLPFPTTIPTAGKPLAMGFGRLQAGAPGSLAVILDQETNRVLVLRSPDGSVRTRPLGANFKSNPTSLRFHDLDHDGLNDVLILIPYEKIKVLLQGPGAEFTEVDVAPPGGTTEQPWAGAADVDGDGHAELLLGQKNFVRAVVLQAGAEAAARTNWTFRVKDQINGAAHNSRIVGVATLHPATNAVPAVFLLDAERKALTLCERDSNGVWQVLRNVPLPFTEFTELQAIALGHSAPNSIAFLGLNAVGWMPTAGDVWEVSELDGYETPIEDGHLHDVVSGDLNQDGRKDLVFLETAKNHLDVVIFAPPHQLVPAIRWPVFEERTFRGRRGDNAEPREALIEDFTGDGKADLAVVVHDRILIYPQE